MLIKKLFGQNKYYPIVLMHKKHENKSLILYIDNSKKKFYNKYI